MTTTKNVTADQTAAILGIFNAHRSEAKGDAMIWLVARKLHLKFATAKEKFDAVMKGAVWTQGDGPELVGHEGSAVAPPAVVEKAPEVPADPLVVRRLNAQVADLKSKLKSVEVRAFKLEDFRNELLALPPPVFSEFQPYVSSGKAGRRTVILHISDIQYGEYIDYDAIDGVNSYSMEIANARLERFFVKSHRFMTELWQGEPVEKIVVLLNGDMISGALHHELDRTDLARPMEASSLVAAQLVSGLRLLARIGVPIDVISTVGNHGRLTLKPESKGHVQHNWDDLVAMLVETNVKDNPQIKVIRSKSVDAKFSVYGFPMLVTHGDRIGSRGGQGFMGATATILRGQSKVFMDYAQRGEHLYKIFTGHFHTPCETVYGYGNNCLAGVSEYARDGRMTPTPAAQGYFVVHEELGVIETRQIMVGVIEEGSSHSPASKYH